jgi:hypothetical protein
MISVGGLRFRQVHLDRVRGRRCPDGWENGRESVSREPLDFEVVDGYARIALPPVGAHAVIVLE